VAEKHKVRTTINPDVDLEVDDAELADLRAQGLLHKADGKTVKSDDTKGGDAK
jgi:hypothetical protein